MTPNNKAEALAHLESIWGSRPETRIGIVIIDYLASHIESKYLPITIFFEIAAPQTKEKDVVLNVVNYFVGADLNLLKIDVELIENDEALLLDRDQALAATKHHIHPITGNIDPELSGKLFFCFSPSDIAKKVLEAN